MAQINALESTENHFLLGESLRPLLTCDMGSSIEIFDTSGPAGSGPPPLASRPIVRANARCRNQGCQGLTGPSCPPSCVLRSCVRQ